MSNEITTIGHSEKALLDAYSLASIIVDVGGTILASNKAFDVLVADRPENWTQLLINRAHAISVLRQIQRSRRVRLVEKYLLEPLSNHVIESTRLQTTQSHCTRFLLEFHPRSWTTRSFAELSERKREADAAATKVKELKSSLKGAISLAHIDGLTGVPNRRAFAVHLERAWQLAFEERQHLSLLLMDIDFFKGINDGFGHAQGDRVLYQIATLLQHISTRAEDFFARYGGEEFAAILPRTDARAACEIGERMRQAVESLAIPHPDSSVAGHVTISIGAHTVKPTHSRPSPPEVLRQVDLALYQAKASGRNCLIHKSLGLVARESGAIMQASPASPRHALSVPC